MPFENPITPDSVETKAAGHRVVVRDFNGSGIVEFFTGDIAELAAPNGAGRIHVFMTSADVFRSAVMFLESPDFGTGVARISIESGSVDGSIPEHRPAIVLTANKVTVAATKAIFSGDVEIAGTLTGGGGGGTAFTNLAITAPYTNVAGSEFQHRIDSAGNIHLRGLINRNAAASGAILATLPVGFRPTRTVVMPLTEATLFAVLNRIEITAAGVVTLHANGGPPTQYRINVAFTNG